MSNPVVSATAVANAFIARGARDGKQFTPMQLLKLTYITHGWSLAFFDKPLMDDDIEAWKYGPVIPNLYKAIRHYRGNPVTTPIMLLNGEIDDITEEQNKLIEFVYRRYGHLDGISLSALTHEPNTPWYEFFNKITWGRKIPDAIIAKHYKEKLEELKKKHGWE